MPATLPELPDPVLQLCTSWLASPGRRALRRTCRRAHGVPIGPKATLRVNLAEPALVAATAAPAGAAWWWAAARVELVRLTWELSAVEAAIERLGAACPNVAAVSTEEVEAGRHVMGPHLRTGAAALRAWPALTAIRYIPLTDAHFAEAERWGALLRIGLTHLDATTAAALCRASPLLEEVESRAADALPLAALLRGLPRLRRLRCTVFKAADAAGVFADCPATLEALELTVLDGLGNLSATGLPRCGAAVTLRLGGDRSDFYAHRHNPWPVLQTLPRLEDLVFDDVGPLPEPPSTLRLTALRRLQFLGAGPGWDLQTAVAQACPALTAVTLGATAAGLTALAAACPALAELRVVAGSWQEDAAAALRGVAFPRLRVLALSFTLKAPLQAELAAACPLLETATLCLTPRGLETVLRACPRLTALTLLLDETPTEDCGSLALSGTKLRELGLFHCGAAQLAVLDAIVGAPPPPVAAVRLVLPHVNGDLPPSLLALLTRGAVALDSLCCVPSEATLLALAAARVPLRSVNLRGPGVTDRALLALCGACPELEAVEVSAGALTDAGLARGAALLGPGLRRLRVRCEGTTAAGLEAARGTCPWAVVD